MRKPLTGALLDSVAWPRQGTGEGLPSRKGNAATSRVAVCGGGMTTYSFLTSAVGSPFKMIAFPGLQNSSAQSLSESSTIAHQGQFLKVSIKAAPCDRTIS
jgi:hypothetical protein